MGRDEANGTAREDNIADPFNRVSQASDVNAQTINLELALAALCVASGLLVPMNCFAALFKLIVTPRPGVLLM